MPVSPTLARTAMPVRRRTAIVVAVVAAILLLTLAFVVTPLLNVDRYRPQAISYLQKKTGKQVEIGRLALTFFPLTVHIDHLGVKNPPIFPSGYVIQVARIDVGLSVGALLHRQVVIKSLLLDDPLLNLTSDPDGPWNFENPQSKISANGLSPGSIARVEIKRGLIIASIGKATLLWVRIGAEPGALQMKIFSHYASRRNECRVRAVFEVKQLNCE